MHPPTIIQDLTNYIDIQPCRYFALPCVRKEYRPTEASLPDKAKNDYLTATIAIEIELGRKQQEALAMHFFPKKTGKRLDIVFQF